MSNAPVSPKRPRWWLALAILAADAVAIAWILLSDTFESWMVFPVTTLAVLAGLVLLAVWLLFLSRLRWRTRLISLVGAALVAGVAVGISQLTRWEGSVNGSGLPRLVWKWERRQGEGLTMLEVKDQKAGSVDLAAASPDDYPRFLGSGGKAIVPGVRLARDWTGQQPKEIWRRPIGLGWSAFAVVGHWAVTQEQRGDNELVVCYDARSGEPLWVHSNPVRFSEKMGGDGPRATPTISGGRVYALGATGILDCLEGKSGKPVWSRATLEEHGLPNLIWGKSSSPLVLDELVVVSGGDAPGSLLAYHKDTGKPAWEATEDKASYSSPVAMTLAGVGQIVSVNAASVAGHDPADGKLLWKYDWPGDFAKCSQPVALAGDRVFISAGYGLGAVVLQIKAGPAKGAQEVSEVWKNKNLKTQFTNVAIRDGFAYGLDDGILECVELARGDRKWKAGRYGHGQVILVEDLLLVQAENGDVVLVEANPDGHHELGRFHALRGKTWNNPVVSGSYLLVRNDQEAACYRLPMERKASENTEKGRAANLKSEEQVKPEK
jgi:outer membrane protein assembly factor BamB